MEAVINVHASCRTSIITLPSGAITGTMRLFGVAAVVADASINVFSKYNTFKI